MLDVECLRESTSSPRWLRGQAGGLRHTENRGAELRLSLERSRMLMHDRREILREQNQIVLQCVGRLHAIEMNIRDRRGQFFIWRAPSIQGEE